MPDTRKNEAVKRNYAAFCKQRKRLVATFAGKFSLIHGADFFGVYDTENDAKTAATIFLPDDLYSVQKIEPEPGRPPPWLGPSEIAPDAMQTPPLNRPWYWWLIPPTPPDR